MGFRQGSAETRGIFQRNRKTAGIYNKGHCTFFYRVQWWQKRWRQTGKPMCPPRTRRKRMSTKRSYRNLIRLFLRQTELTFKELIAELTESRVTGSFAPTVSRTLLENGLAKSERNHCWRKTKGNIYWIRHVLRSNIQ